MVAIIKGDKPADSSVVYAEIRPRDGFDCSSDAMWIELPTIRTVVPVSSLRLINVDQLEYSLIARMSRGSQPARRLNPCRKTRMRVMKKRKM